MATESTPRNDSLGARLRRLYWNVRPVRWASKLLPIAVLFAVWELVSGALVPAAVFPPFSAVLPEIVALGSSGELYGNLLDTLFRGLVGVFVAASLAIPTGLAMARSERVSRNLDPLISLTYPVPKSPLIPLVVFWLGMGHLSRIVLAVIGAFLPIVISTYNGAETVKKEFLWVSQSLGLGSFEETYKVLLPAALPTIVTGLRIGLIFSFIIVISSEMIMAQTGLGVLVVEFGQFGQYERVFAVVVWIAVLVAGLDRLYLYLSSRLLRWSDQEVGGI